MSVSTQVGKQFLDIMKSNWYGHGWNSSGGAEESHVASYTCLLASGYKAAYQVLNDVKEAHDAGHHFHGELDRTDPVMDLVERAIVRAIVELYPEAIHDKSKIAESYTDPSIRQSIVIHFNDSWANKEQAIAVAERAYEFIEEQERIAEMMKRPVKWDDLPRRFSFGESVSDEDAEQLLEDMDDLLDDVAETVEDSEAARRTEIDAVVEEAENRPRPTRKQTA